MPLSSPWKVSATSSLHLCTHAPCCTPVLLAVISIFFSSSIDCQQWLQLMSSVFSDIDLLLDKFFFFFLFFCVCCCFILLLRFRSRLDDGWLWAVRHFSDQPCCCSICVFECLWVFQAEVWWYTDCWVHGAVFFLLGSMLCQVLASVCHLQWYGALCTHVCVCVLCWGGGVCVYICVCVWCTYVCGCSCGVCVWCMWVLVYVWVCWGGGGYICAFLCRCICVCDACLCIAVVWVVHVSLCVDACVVYIFGGIVCVFLCVEACACVCFACQ